jgi:uncharacterized protein YbaR (Trm112 family)
MEQTCSVCRQEKEDCIEHTLGGLIVCPTCHTALYIERAVAALVVTKAREIHDAENP